MKQGKKQRNYKNTAFTLVELLVVIAIIAIVAGLSVGVFGGASVQKVRMMTKSQLQELQAGIQAYKSKYGSYPPSDPRVETIDTNSSSYYYPGLTNEVNPLFYELTGTYYDAANGRYQSIFKQDNYITTTQLTNVFGASMAGLANAHASGQNPEPFVQLKPDRYEEVDFRGAKVILLTVPSRSVTNSWSRNGNYWRYRARDPNGYNPTTYDLWAEIRGKKVSDKEIIGNWNVR